MRFRLLARPRVHLLALLVAGAVAGCDSGSDESGSAVSFRADGTLVEFNAASAGLVGSRLSVGAVRSGGQSSFGFLVPPTTGTYSIVDDDLLIFAFYQNAAGVSYTATRGSITLQTLSSTVASGTFAFTAEDEDGDDLEVTQGRFSVPVVDVPTARP